VFDIATITLEEVDAEYAKTLNTLERLSALRAAVAEQDHRRVRKLIAEYNIAKRKETEKG